MESPFLHTTLRWTIISLVLAPWITASFGRPLPEAFIVAGALVLVQAGMIATNYRGAGTYHRQIGERTLAKARARGHVVEYTDARIARSRFVGGLAVLALGVAATAGLFSR